MRRNARKGERFIKFLDGRVVVFIMRTVLKKSGRLGKANCDAVIRVCDQVGNHSQLSIRLVERDNAFDIPGRIQNANLA